MKCNNMNLPVTFLIQEGTDLPRFFARVFNLNKTSLIRSVLIHF